MAIVTSNDWIPRYYDAGYDVLIKSLMEQFLEFSEFVRRLTNDRMGCLGLVILSMSSSLAMPPLVPTILAVLFVLSTASMAHSSTGIKIKS